MANSVTTSTRRKRNTPDIMPLGRPASSLALRSASALGKVPLTNDPAPRETIFGQPRSRPETESANALRRLRCLVRNSLNVLITTEFRRWPIASHEYLIGGRFMFVTVVVVLCYLSTNDCAEEIVTSSSLDRSVSFQSCITGGQAALAQWKDRHPIYRSETWHIQRYKCVPGHYEAKVRV